MVNSARTEATLGDFEAAAFAEQDVRGRDADVFKQNLCVAVRGVVVAEDGEESLDREAGRVHGHEDHRLLLVGGGGWVGLAHEDANFAARVAGTRGPPLAAVNDV